MGRFFGKRWKIDGVTAEPISRHFLFFNFGDDAILRGIAENEFFLHRPVKGVVQHHMDAAHGGIAQSGFFLFLYLSQPAIAL